MIRARQLLRVFDGRGPDRQGFLAFAEPPRRRRPPNISVRIRARRSHMPLKKGAMIIATATVTILGTGAAVFAANDHEDRTKPAKTLYIWTGDQARRAPDFLAVINFDEESNDYGKVVRTVPIPPPGNVGNEPHHCHLSADKNTLACGGLLSI